MQQITTSLGALHAQRVTAAWNAIVPKRVAGICYLADAIMVLHPTKGWRRISHKRLGIA